MASIRKRLDDRMLMRSDVEFFREAKGSVPLCCCQIRFRDPITGEKLRENLYTCDQLKELIPYSAFKTFCLECQEYISKKLEEIDIESLR